MLKHLFILFFLIWTPMLWAQDADLFREQMRQGELMLKSEQYFKALEHFKLAEKLDGTSLKAKQGLGICYFHCHQLSKAKQYLEYCIQEEKKPDPDLFLNLASTYHALSKFKPAIAQYKSFLKGIDQDDYRRDMIKERIRRCAFGMKNSTLNTDVIVENLGRQINSRANDFAPILSPNFDGKMYFSSNRAGVLGGKRNDNGLLDEENGRLSTDMFSSEVVNGEWTAVKAMSYLLNGPRNDVILDFGFNGQSMIFFKGFTLYGGEILVDTFKQIEERTLFSDFFISPMSPENGDISMHLFNDSTLIFSSRKEGGYGGLDLYISQRKQNVWTAPVNMGPEINSAYDETSPFLAKDGRTLYFSSNNSAYSLGGLDILRIKYDDRAEKWMKLENLGLPINSSEDDAFFRLSSDGMKAYFSSKRKNGFGGEDIYGVYFKKAKEEQLDYSIPNLFADVSSFRNDRLGENNSDNNVNDKFPSQPIEQFYYESLHFNEESDLLSGNNQKMLNRIFNLLNSYPSIKLLMTSHSDETEPEKFDLFFSVKRAENVANYLIEQGINPSRISVRGCGKQFPIAQNSVRGKANPVGRRLNRRIELTFDNTEGLPLRLIKKEFKISKQMVSEKGTFYSTAVTGLSYKIKISESPQTYNGDLILEFPSATVDKNMASKNYVYTIGLYQTFSSANQFNKLLQKRAILDSEVIAYLNGIPVNDNNLGSLLEAFPDLQRYVLAKSNR